MRGGYGFDSTRDRGHNGGMEGWTGLMEGKKWMGIERGSEDSRQHQCVFLGADFAHSGCRSPSTAILLVERGPSA